MKGKRIEDCCEKMSYPEDAKAYCGGPGADPERPSQAIAELRAAARGLRDKAHSLEKLADRLEQGPTLERDEDLTLLDMISRVF